MAGNLTRNLIVAGATSLLLAGCENFEMPKFLKPAATQEAAPSEDSVHLVERDVEAPEVFQITEDGLWDGRPSLGGVWVAHPDVTEPERVIIRNEAQGKFVIGALFRRERENPGPKLMVSSDAAAALGILAGQPTRLNVTALRREEVAAASNIPDQAESAGTEGADTVSEAPLEPLAAETAASETPQPAPPTTSPAASSLAKPFIQIGLFSVESNARDTAERLRRDGILPAVNNSTTRGKTFWRVVVGPASNRLERSALLRKVKALGFSDAYFVRN